MIKKAFPACPKKHTLNLLTRNQICVKLPILVAKVIMVNFQASDKDYEDVSKMLAIILNE